MNHDHFPYVYDRGHWLRNDEPEDHPTLRGIIETALCLFAMCVCLVAVMMLWLCG